jgi:hypothetical protein
MTEQALKRTGFAIPGDARGRRPRAAHARLRLRTDPSAVVLLRIGPPRLGPDDSPPLAALSAERRSGNRA